MKKYLPLFMIMLFLVLSPALQAEEVLYGGEHLKDKYRQNETLEIVATVTNLSNKTLTIRNFNITIVRSKPTGRPKPLFSILINITKDLSQGEGLTVRYPLELKNFPPDEYNLTAYFNVFLGGEAKELYIYKNQKFRLLPAIEIPPIAYITIGVMAAIILVYVGYGIAMRFRH